MTPRHQCVTHAYNWKLAGVSQEEDGRVVEDPVPIALIRVEFDREATRVTGAICRSLLSTNRGEACDTLRLLADI